ARLVLGIDRMAKSDRRDLHLQASDIDAFFRLDQIDDATVGAHLEPIQRAGFHEHRMLRESSERRVDHLLRTERFAATDAGEDLRLVEYELRLCDRCYLDLRDKIYR